MKHHQNVLPEEQDEHNQSLLEDLRHAYQPEFHNAHAHSRVRERLLAGDGWLEPTKRTQLSTTQTQERKKYSTTNQSVVTFKARRQRSVRRALALVAATLVISFLTGSLVLILHMTNKISLTGSPINGGVQATLIEMHMFSESTGWALSVGNRVLRTTDGGINWQEVTPPDLLALETRFTLAGPRVFSDTLTAWIGVTVNQKQAPEYHSQTAELIFHTTDGGKTWQKTVLKLSGKMAGQLIFVNSHTGWLISQPSVTIEGPERDNPLDIWHTTDGGTTWTKILDGSSSSAHVLNGIIAPSFSFGDEHVGLIIGQNHRLYRTTDSGATWQLQPWPAVIDKAVTFREPHFFTAKDALFSSTALTFGSSGYAQTLGIVIYSTHDAGLTWHQSNTFTLTTPQDKQANVGWTPASGTPMFTDMQHGWVEASTEATTTSTGTSNLVQYQTTDGGQHWIQLPLNSQLPLNLLSNTRRTSIDVVSTTFISPNIGWLIVEGSKSIVLLKTEDGGQSWTQVHAHFPSFIRGASPI